MPSSTSSTRARTSAAKRAGLVGSRMGSDDALASRVLERVVEVVVRAGPSALRRPARGAATAPRSARCARGPSTTATSAQTPGGAGRRRRSARAASRVRARARVQLGGHDESAVMDLKVVVIRPRGFGVQRAVAMPGVEEVVGRACGRARRSGRRTRAAASIVLGRRRCRGARRAPRRSTARGGCERRVVEPVRARRQPRIAAELVGERIGARRARWRRAGSFTSTAADCGGDAPPRARERVDHAQLEPAARPDRREQRGEVVFEVVGRWATRVRVPVLDPVGEGEPGRDRERGRSRPRRISITVARRARSAPTPARPSTPLATGVVRARVDRVPHREAGGAPAGRAAVGERRVGERGRRAPGRARG